MSTPENTFSAKFSERLQKAMGETWTQQKIADAVGVSQASVQRWLKGTIPGGFELMKLADILGVKVEYLIGWDEVRVELSEEFSRIEALIPPGDFAEQQELFNDLVIESARLRQQQMKVDAIMERLKEITSKWKSAQGHKQKVDNPAVNLRSKSDEAASRSLEHIRRKGIK